MSEEKARQSFLQLERALDRLGELAEKKIDSNEIIVDAAIQRFEFCIELFWKTLKRFLQEEGIEAGTPKEVMKHAFQQSWLSDEQAWLGMLKDRNRTSHIYDEATAKEIFKRIRGDYYPELHRTYQFLRDRLSNVLCQ